MAVAERTDAKKERYGREAALELARAASKVVVSRGRSVTVFDMKKNPPDEETLLAHLLGPTGNLRAPTIRKGKTLLVGFNEATYERALK
jgi:arsenate reductase-like glutaredoxin family protein